MKDSTPKTSAMAAHSTIEIARFADSDQQGVIDVILPIQRDEFGIPITIEDQPDLRSIPNFYQTGKGDFWVAKSEGKIIGTIGLKDIGNSQAALRKMFVSARFRGRGSGVAAQLLGQLLTEARSREISDIFLGTTEKFLAAHRFYEKHGFSEIKKDMLPNSFPVMVVDTKFYVIRLSVLPTQS
jgi:N-acetylglutamate synthase-like GNAT family acetyltransferase